MSDVKLLFRFTMALGVALLATIVVMGYVFFKQQSDEIRSTRAQQSNTAALCALQADLQRRVATTTRFLKTHPEGIPGVPIATLTISLRGQEATLRALRPLVCPK